MNQVVLRSSEPKFMLPPFRQRQFAGRNQIRIVRAMLDFVVEQINKDGEQQEVNGAEQKNRGQNRVGLDHGGQTFRRAQQALHNPRLAPHLGGEPARLIGDLRAEHREHQQPEQPALLKQRPAPEIKKAEG